MKIIADRMDIDILEVIAQPRPSRSASCPITLVRARRPLHTDRSVLPDVEGAAARVHTRFIELAGEINSAMPHWVVGKVIDALNLQQKSVKGKPHPGVGDRLQEERRRYGARSPAVELMSLLAARGARVEYCDPHVPVFSRMRKYRFELESVTVNAQTVPQYDLVLIATNHDAFDYEMIREHARLVVDTRGVYRQPAPNIVRA